MRLCGTKSLVMCNSFIEDLQLGQSNAPDGTTVVFVEKSKPLERLLVNDFQIQTVIDAGLIDKLAVNSPLQLSLLEKQDLVYSQQELIEKLDLDVQVENRKAELEQQQQALIEAYEKEHNITPKETTKVVDKQSFNN